MNFDVIPYKESEESERWHWQIISLPKIGAGEPKVTCCTEPKDNEASDCPGFDDIEAAKKDGRSRVKELEAGRVTVVDTPS